MKRTSIPGVAAALLLAACGDPATTLSGPISATGGGIYVSNFGARVALGQVLRIEP